MKNRNLYLWVGIAVGVLAILFPHISPKFQLRMLTEIIILALFAMTWKMMLNEGGMFSFGHAVYFGLGAYASVLGWLHIPGLSLMSGILLGDSSAALIGFILSAFLVRMSGTYFALLTLAFNQLIWAIVWKWRDVTGGDDGLGKFPKPDLLGISMKDPVNFYYVSLVIIGRLPVRLLVFLQDPLGKHDEEHQIQRGAGKVYRFQCERLEAGLLDDPGIFCGDLRSSLCPVSGVHRHQQH